MTLLAEIVDSATADSVSIASLLRKVKVLAARTATPSLAVWINHELDGYADGATLPRYRGPHPTNVRGHFVSQWGSGHAENVAISVEQFPESFGAERLFEQSFRQPIEGLASFVGMDTQPVTTWNNGTIGIINHRMEKGEFALFGDPPMLLLSARVSVGAQVFVDIVGAVRNRVLDLALEFEAMNPHLGEVGVAVPDPAAASLIVNNIYGDVGSMAVAGPGSTINTGVQQGDLESLIRVLRESGVDEDDLDELRVAIDEDAGHLGHRVRSWVGGRVLPVAGAVLTGASGDVVGAAVAAYFGIGS